MFHKNAGHSAGSGFTVLDVVPSHHPQQQISTPARLVLVTAGGGSTPRTQPSTLIELVSIFAPRCSAFLAEAAVLVLVLALLDRFMAKGRLEMGWFVGTFAISLALLATSVTTDFVSRRWLNRH